MTRSIRLSAVLIALGFLAGWGQAGPGLGELSLDREAVTALLQAHLPGTVGVPVPGLGKVPLKLRAGSPVFFRNKGLETEIVLELAEAGISGRLALRFIPFLDRDKGILVFRPVSARPSGGLAGLPDLAPLLPPLEFPRLFEWLAPGTSAGRQTISVSLEGIDIGEDRLLLKLGLAARGAGGAGKKPPQK